MKAVLTRPEANPDCLGATSLIAASDTELSAMPAPKPSRSSAAATAATSPNTPIAFARSAGSVNRFIISQSRRGACDLQDLSIRRDPRVSILWPHGQGPGEDEHPLPPLTNKVSVCLCREPRGSEP
jgi:hypothetical protein